MAARAQRRLSSRGLLGGAVLLLLVGAALAPRLVRVEEASAPAECEIRGLAEYAIEEIQEGACSSRVYVRACRTAQLLHRERCRDFCGALKDLGGRRFCVGSSKPMARLFEPDRHCRELRHDYFQVTCSVTASCTCDGSASG